VPAYFVEIVARAGCGCEIQGDYLLEQAPEPGDVVAAVADALDPGETPVRPFLSERHEHGGHEKLTITAQVKVR
jgi:hypothetical protein